MTLNRKTLSGGALALLAVLFVAIVLLSNLLFRGFRADLTENRLYTLSDGTDRILGKLDEPVRLSLYFSEKATAESNRAEVRNLRVYFDRIRDLLDEMAARSKGKLLVEVIDPIPYSEAEDRAAASGIQGIPLGPAGEKIFLGLVGTNATDGQGMIPFFDPGKESVLEYDVAKLIQDLATTKKRAIGLLTGLPMASGVDPAAREMREPWAVYQELSQLFDIRQLDASTLKTVDPDVAVLVLVHPKQLGDDAEYAIDQFVLRGGHLLVFVDPNAELDQAADMGNPQAAMFADKSSNLPALFKAWGVEFAPDKVVLDRAHALQVGTSPGGPPVRHPGILGFQGADLPRNDVVTASLEAVNMASVGHFRLAKDSSATLTPIIQSSNEAMTILTERVKFLPDPSVLFQDYVATGERYIIAGRLEGKFKTAFPNRSGNNHLAEAKDPGLILLVADTDVLSDRLWVRVQNFFGQKVLNAFANNGDLFINAVDNLSGSSDLISIRGRASSQRPFTRVEQLKRTADDRFRAKEQELQRELTETERKLTELQSGKSDDQSQVLSPEQKSELDKFLHRKLDIRKELREVRRQLDADIEALGARLKFLNIALVPILLTLGTLVFVGWKNKRSTVKGARR